VSVARCEGADFHDIPIDRIVIACLEAVLRLRSAVELLFIKLSLKTQMFV
jgi:hypothetical protein